MKIIKEHTEGFRWVDGDTLSAPFAKDSEQYDELIAEGCEVELIPQSEKDTYQTKQAQDKINQDAQAYLTSTDWLIVRSFDTGAEVPEDVKAKRQEARAQIK